MRILYNGNNDDILNSLKKNKNYTVFENLGNLEVLIYLNNNIIDVIISEFDLPDKNGFAFFDEIFNKKKYKVIPFILLQNKFDKKVFKKAFDSGIKDYFVIGSTPLSIIMDRINSFRKENGLSNTKKFIHTDKNFKMPLSKRLFDIFVASLVLIILSPILLIVMIAIRIESKGKIYYTSKRVGTKIFDFYKLRSMKVGADKLLNKLAKTSNQYQVKSSDQNKEISKCKKCQKLPEGEYCSPLKYDGSEIICDNLYIERKEIKANENSSFIKIVDDPRITKIGKIIRNTSIDELPQLINVIKGDMSLVGNRPLPVYEAECLTKDNLSKRFLAPAGITGLWQVELRGKSGNMSEEERIELDNKYADYFENGNYSLWFDLKILLRTIPALFQRSTV